MKALAAPTILILGSALFLGGCGEDVLAGVVCDEGYYVDAGVCVALCTDPQIYDSDSGECICEDVGWTVEELTCVCDTGYEMVEGDCLVPCADGTTRVGVDCVPWGGIEGRICDRNAGEWFEGVTVTVTLNDGTELTAVTDADGYYAISGVPPGGYYVDYSGPSGYFNTLPVMVEAGVMTSAGDSLCAEPLGHLRGAVCDVTTGLWVQGAMATLNDATATATATDGFGVFMFYSIPSGDYEVTITYPDLSTEVRTATVTPSQITDIGPTTCVAIDPCPGATPTANAGPDQAAVPDQTVQLDGSGSSDPGGQALTYQWRVASRPIGSVADVSNSAIANPTLLADVSGDFSVCLIVINTDGCYSPEDCMAINVAPLVAFHIELTWDTDNSDLDLHYKYPSGNYFGMFGGDCYFGATNPSWGPGGAEDDPRLDVDNLVGFGPENINMDQLYDGSPFEIGVHYYGGNGDLCYNITDQPTCDAEPLCTVYTDPLGGTGCVGIPPAGVTPRIRVYVEGVMEYEAFSPSPMSCDQFWAVAQIAVSGNGTSVSVTPVNSLTSNDGHGVCP